VLLASLAALWAAAEPRVNPRRTAKLVPERERTSPRCIMRLQSDPMVEDLAVAGGHGRAVGPKALIVGDGAGNGGCVFGGDTVPAN